MAWTDPSQLTDEQLEAALTEIEGRLGELRSCARLGELQSKRWRLKAEQRFRRQMEKRKGTYFGHAGDVELELGGRFAKLTPTTVTASEPTVKYPKIENGPWAKDECGPEPPLGIDINAQEPVGEKHEVEASSTGTVEDRGGPVAESHVSATGSTSKGFRRRV